MTSTIIRSRIAALGVFEFISLSTISLFAAEAPQAVFAEKHRAVLKEHCFSSRKIPPSSTCGFENVGGYQACLSIV